MEDESCNGSSSCINRPDEETMYQHHLPYSSSAVLLDMCCYGSHHALILIRILILGYGGEARKGIRMVEKLVLKLS
jgi:hypothetical protein